VRRDLVGDLVPLEDVLEGLDLDAERLRVRRSARISSCR
jgi:hypothetical protein